MKSMSRFAMVATLGAVLVGCGKPVEVPTAHVGKIMGTSGYQEGVITTSKFRLPKCWTYCDKLVVLDVSDQQQSENMNLFMPKDKLNVQYDLRMTMAVKPGAYEDIFAKISPQLTDDDQLAIINIGKVYQTYAQQIIRAEAREILSKYSIAQVVSSREAINDELADTLAKSVSEKTPFTVRYVGLADVKYPEVITNAQENAAERREKIQQEEAQLEISKVALERQLQEQQLQRKIEVEKAQAEAEVNRILAESITPSYVKYRSMQIMEKIAESDNKVFVPTEMLDSVAGQVQLGRQ